MNKEQRGTQSTLTESSDAVRAASDAVGNLGFGADEIWGRITSGVNRRARSNRERRIEKRESTSKVEQASKVEQRDEQGRNRNRRARSSKVEQETSEQWLKEGGNRNRREGFRDLDGGNCVFRWRELSFGKEGNEIVFSSEEMQRVLEFH